MTLLLSFLALVCIAAFVGGLYEERAGLTKLPPEPIYRPDDLVQKIQVIEPVGGANSALSRIDFSN